jgi:large subunit ribosomal protein L11
MSIVKRINELTSDYSGMRVPVKVTIDTDTKSFDVEVGLPTASALLAKEAGAAKGAKTKDEVAGNITFAQLVKIAKAKMQQSYSASLKAAAKEVLGSCVSMGISVEGKPPRIISEEISKGTWDAQIGKED